MPNTITPELQAELLQIIRQEMRQQAARTRKQNMYTRICKDFDPELERYNHYSQSTPTLYGKVIRRQRDAVKWANLLRPAIGTLLRVMYHVKYVSQLPEDKEPEIRVFFQEVLALMERHSPPEDAP